MTAMSSSDVTLRSTAPELALEIESLHVQLGSAQVVNDVSLTVAPGEMLALVGESGAGKSMTARAVIGLLPPVARVSGGTIRLHGRDVTHLDERAWRSIRGRGIGMVFQNPLRSLNPTMKIGVQVAEAVKAHDRSVSRAEAQRRAIELLKQVQIPNATKRYDEYPHQLSGGMRQRVVIAIALSGSPGVLLADEPTTALDVTTQAEILRLLADLQHTQGTAVVLVTHDMRIAEEHADRVAVMYAGQVVEHGPVAEVVNRPRMPYTRALMSAVPQPDALPHSELPIIAGRPPDLRTLPLGCSFAPRCGQARPDCSDRPPLLEGDETHRFRCWHPLTNGDR